MTSARLDAHSSFTGVVSLSGVHELSVVLKDQTYRLIMNPTASEETKSELTTHPSGTGTEKRVKTGVVSTRPTVAWKAPLVYPEKLLSLLTEFSAETVKLREAFSVAASVELVNESFTRLSTRLAQMREIVRDLPQR